MPAPEVQGARRYDCHLAYLQSCLTGRSHVMCSGDRFYPCASRHWLTVLQIYGVLREYFKDLLVDFKFENMVKPKELSSY
jgi:hypothetical protein